MEKQVKEFKAVTKKYKDGKDEIWKLDLKINVDAKELGESKAEQSTLDDEIKKLESELKIIGRIKLKLSIYLL